MSEPFPELSGAPSKNTKSDNIRLRRRQSSGIGQNIAGDVNVPSFATGRKGTPPPLNSPAYTDMKADKTGARSKRRSVRRTLSKFKRQCIRHTWLLPLILTLLIASLYLVYPYPSNPIAACLFISYPLDRNDPLIPARVRDDPSAPLHYGKGARDFAFVGFYIIVLSFTREFCMQRLIKPIALHYGIRSRAKQSRFMEQAYTALYFAFYGPFGLWIMSRTPVWYFNTTGMYEDFPHRTHEALVKAYYLLQASYWAQQLIVLVLMLEKPRKDWSQLVAHHVITISLIWLSYRFHFVYMGLAVYITHDVSDFFLATSKCLNYIDASFVEPYFFVFLVVWAYLRHYINLKILWSVLTEFKTVGPYELNWETQQYKCWIAQYITFALLASLQAVNLFWFFLICRIAVRFVLYSTADDDRSEYDPSEEETEERVKELKALKNELNETADAARGVLSTATAESDSLKQRNGAAKS